MGRGNRFFSVFAIAENEMKMYTMCSAEVCVKFVGFSYSAKCQWLFILDWCTACAPQILD